jgi:hypothetical protein
MKIESTDQDIRTLLSSGYYKIPRFQRPYSWDRENIQDFWDDVVRGQGGDYFIGPMVVYKDGQQRYGVVDGQQRLTTITILLACIRDLLRDRGFVDQAAGIQGVIERKNIDNKPEFIVSTETSYPYFQDRIQSWDPAALKNPQQFDEEDSLASAHDQLRSLVKDVDECISRDPTFSNAKKSKAVLTKLLGIRDEVLSLKVIFVKLDDEDDAYVIFETLNTRGKDLNLADLVKNYLTKSVKSKNPATDPTKLKWKRILETIEGSSAGLNTDTFLHHFWLSKYDYLPAKQLFKTLKKRVTPKDAAQFLQDLLDDSVLYRTINETGYRKWAKEEKPIELALRALRIFKVQQPTPCVLSLAREYLATKKIKKKGFEDALVAIEKFHFLFTAVTSQRSSGGISAMYAALGRRLSEAKDSQDAAIVIQDLKKKLRDRVPSFEEFKALFPEILFTDNLTKQKDLVKYILVCIDRRRPSATVPDYEQMTIEHLVPQSMIGSTDLDEEVVGQMGNLLLVPQELNNKLKNKTFAEKKAILLAAGFNFPKEMKAATKWDAADIRQRTNVLAKEAFEKVWKL